MSGPAQTENPIKRRDLYFMLAHPTECKVLMLREGDCWTLPHFVSEELFGENVAHVARTVRRLWGLEATILRCAYFYMDEKVERRLEAIYAMEKHSRDWTLPPDSAWVEASTLRDLPLVVASHKEVITTWLTERETGVLPAQRSPWAKEGWLASAQDWIASELSGLGIAVTGPVDQLKTWGISCLLTIPTQQGTFYFKAVPPIFAQEPIINRALAERFLGNVPAPIAIRMEPEQSWMLLAEIGGREMRSNAAPEQWIEALSLLCCMQIESVPHVSSLLEMGCADRRLEYLVEEIDPLLDDPLAVGELSSEEIEKLKALAPRLKEMCSELAAYRVPQTLIHGDFHGGNIIITEDDYVVFDWTDAAVSHPFFDLPTLFEFDIPLDQRETLAQTYLRLWADHDYEIGQRLEEAYRLSQPLALMHHAVSYRNIVAMLEPTARWEMFGGSTPWLRLLVAWIDEHGAQTPGGADIGAR